MVQNLYIACEKSCRYGLRYGRIRVMLYHSWRFPRASLRHSTVFLKNPLAISKTRLAKIIQTMTSLGLSPTMSCAVALMRKGGCLAENPAKEPIAHPDSTVGGSISLPRNLNTTCSSLATTCASATADGYKAYGTVQWNEVYTCRNTGAFLGYESAPTASTDLSS